MTNSETNNFHQSVLLHEVLEALRIHDGAWYLDATIGGGGHSEAILKKGAYVLGIDQDEAALETSKTRLSTFYKNGQLKLEKANFADLERIVAKHKISPKGILFDLGVSSYQIGGNQRGFSFQVDETLDMRMNPEFQQVTAKDLVNGLYEKELEQLISKYGEDPLARPIAKAIIAFRKHQFIETTGQLREIIEKVYHRAYRSRSRMNPATKTFQALRIAVNDEIEALKSGLEAALHILQEKGVCVVISFHGLEDKIVKTTFLDWESQELGERMYQKPIVANEQELESNPRSRSAKLRAFIKS
ncbi:16S rRNA (cytosine(1402)-N(4))-methyltransferase RsmH [Candidatus Beckwithbacteria bacterium]|nr:16S rRNA (cytosine(1402)-N(4))-methyltransferase RsmH [Candidatus Beckwithbacteria bacterium]